MGRRPKEEQGSTNDEWLRRQAVQLCGQLPEDARDARRVIDLMREFHERFMISPADKADGGSGTVRVLTQRR